MNRDDPMALEPAPEEHGATLLQDNVFTLFARCAAATPEALAVLAESGNTTYAALAARAEAVCQRLLAMGLAAEQPVGVFMQRRTDLLAVLLGVWKAGGAYVPIDPDDPPERVQRLLRSAGCGLVLGDALLWAALPGGGPGAGAVATRFVDVACIAPAAPGSVPAPCAPGGARLAYLLFTSGSTGEPKAVEVEHRNVVSLLHSARALLHFTPADRYLAAATIAFDASITELFLPLVTGASLLLRERNLLLDARRLAQDIQRHGVSVVQTSPSVWAMLLASVPDFPRVRVLITHAEPVPPALAARLCALGDDVWNLYGPTETTVWATGQRLSLEAVRADGVVPIGRPLAHVQAFVIDAQGRPVADGTAGELCLGGPGVARGYRGQDSLTRERFVVLAGTRVYRSGDLAWRSSAGVLHYAGRNDEQMKIRGVRVEPGEVEAAILCQPWAAQAAVTWYTAASGARAIVAAVVLHPGHAAPLGLRAALEVLEARLPPALLPQRFLFLPRLPMTASGKIDRPALRQLAQAPAPIAPIAPLAQIAPIDSITPAASVTPVAPAPAAAFSETERVLAGIWQRLLGLGAVARDDHFFAIGGDSLAAVQMLVEAEQAFGMQLPVHLVFDVPTLAGLATRIERLRQRGGEGLAQGFVFPVAAAAAAATGSTPLFFSGVNLLLARPGLWAVPCPLYSIANWARGSGFVQAASLAALAAAHLASVRQVQPQGPYRLAGFSLGGLIALEMAQQLRAAGEGVELLFLLDPMQPPAANGSTAGVAARARPEWEPAFGEKLRRYARRVRGVAAGPRGQGPGQWLGRWLAALLPLGRLPLLEWASYQLVHHYGRHPESVLRLLLPRNRWRAFWYAARRMVQGYVAQPYTGPVLAAFGASGRRQDVWAALLGPQAELRSMDCTHDALFEEPARSQWMAWLAEALPARR